MKKIVVISALRDLLAGPGSFLSRNDISLLNAKSNEEVYEFHRVEKADLLLATPEGRDLTGESLCTLIRADSDLREVSIVLVGGDAGSEEKLIRAGANAVFSASAPPEAVLDKAGQLLSVARRRDLRVPVGLRVEGERSGGAFLGYLMNVSASGMLVESDEEMRQGEVIACSFILPTSVHVIAHAEIVRIARPIGEFDVYRYGVRYLTLRERDRAAIEEFIKNQGMPD